MCYKKGVHWCFLGGDLDLTAFPFSPLPPLSRSSQAAAEQAQARTAAPLLRIRSLPPATRRALSDYNRTLLAATLTYMRVGSLRAESAAAVSSSAGRVGWGVAVQGAATRLPLSNVDFSGPKSADGPIAPLAAPVVIRSPFSALRGRDDRFRSARELACELRGGLALSQGQTTPILPDVKVRATERDRGRNYHRCLLPTALPRAARLCLPPRMRVSEAG
jgi:hypothetical protein